MKEIGVGVIGTGYMGRTHTYGYRTIPFYYPGAKFRIRLVGVCSRTIQKAEMFRDQYGFEFSTTDSARLFERPEIQVISICTPNSLHAADLVHALRAGKSVYCEKPLTAGYGQAQEVLEALRQQQEATVGNPSAGNPGAENSAAGVWPQVHQMVFHNRFFPAVLRAREIVEEGRLGRILSFRAAYLHAGQVDAAKPMGWRQDVVFGGGGVLLDLGSHVLDLIYHLLGEYSEILAATHIVHPVRPDREGRPAVVTAEDQVVMMARMKQGALGTIEASKVATGSEDELRLEIHGTGGAVRLNLMDPNWLDFFDQSAPEVPLGGNRGFTRIACVQRYPGPGGEFPASKVSIGWLRGHVHCLYSFLSCVDEGRPASPSLEEGAYIQRVMEAAYRSARENRWVECDFTD